MCGDGDSADRTVGGGGSEGGGGGGEHPIFLTECLWDIGLMGTVRIGFPSFVVGIFPRRLFWWRKYFSTCVGVGGVVASQWSAMVLSRAHWVSQLNNTELQGNECFLMSNLWSFKS